MPRKKKIKKDSKIHKHSLGIGFGHKDVKDPVMEALRKPIKI
jgi:hypothetical protein